MSSKNSQTTKPTPELFDVITEEISLLPDTTDRKEDNIWIFVDETGNSDLHDSYNTIFGLGFLVAYEPEELSKTLSKMRYLLWQQNPKKEAIEFFHAKDDPKPLRNKVFEFLENNKTDLHIAAFDFLYINKNELSTLKIDKDIKNEFINDGLWLSFSYNFIVKFYLSLIYETILTQKDIFPLDSKINVNIVFSRLFSKKEEGEISRVLSNFKFGYELFKEEEYPKTKIQCYFVENKTDYICQMADYFSWSMNRWLCREEKVGFDFVVSLKTELFGSPTDLSSYFEKSINKFFADKNLTNKNTPPIESSFRRET